MDTRVAVGHEQFLCHHCSLLFGPEHVRWYHAGSRSFTCLRADAEDPDGFRIPAKDRHCQSEHSYGHGEVTQRRRQSHEPGTRGSRFCRHDLGSCVLSALSQAVIRQVLGPINPARPDFAKSAAFRRSVLRLRDKGELNQARLQSQLNSTKQELPLQPASFATEERGPFLCLFPSF
jgi:hypothetical protein